MTKISNDVDNVVQLHRSLLLVRDGQRHTAPDEGVIKAARNGFPFDIEVNPNYVRELKERRARQSEELQADYEMQRDRAVIEYLSFGVTGRRLLSLSVGG